MSLDDLFTLLASRMILGIMTHEQLMNSYLFLNLPGYAALHEYHYISETNNYVRFCKYVSDRFRTLVRPGKFENPDVVPESWYGSSKEEVTPAMRKKAMAAALDTWCSWERETLSVYEDAYKGLHDGGRIAAADFLKDYISDVEEELIFAENERVSKASMNYDIVSILEEQDDYEKTFKKKIRKSFGG